MPQLETATGDTVLDDLTHDEIAELRRLGVDVPDYDGGGDSDDDTDTESDIDDTDDEVEDTPESDPDATDNPDADGDSDSDAGTDADADADADPDPSGDAPSGDEPDTTDGEPMPGDGRITDDHDADVDDGGDDTAPTYENDASLDESLAERLDVEDMDSARAPDDRDVSRWESLVEQIEKYGRDVERRKRERDERLTDNRIWSDDARDRARNSGAIRRLKDGLRQLVTRPTPEPALQGPEIDMRNVVRRASGQKNVKKVFRESVETETGDRCIGLATDLSGSMHRDMDDLRVACGVIAEATDIIGDGFVWSSFQYKYGENTLRLVTGPNEDFKWRHVDSIQAGGDEPTAAGIRDCRSLMEQTTARTHVLLCITDGKALVTEDGRRTMDEEPIRHARQAVRECRHEGVEVIGVGIGSMDEQKMAETFGDGNYVLTSIDTLAEDILDIYQEQMTVSR